MADSPNHDPNEIRLWRQCAASGKGERAGACPGAVELAAYLDGGLSAEAAATLEAHLVRCPACLDAVVELRELRAGEAPAGFIAPETVAARAKALVPNVLSEQEAVYRAAVRHWLAPNWSVWGQRAAALAAGLALSFVGYHFGATSARTTAAEDLLLAEASFGLYGTADGIDETLLPLELEAQDQ